MATSLVSDLIEGASLTLTSQAGYQTTRVMILQDVEGASGHAVLYNAVTDALIPVRGTVHPTITGIYVDSITAEPIVDNSNIKVTIIYKPVTNDTKPPPTDGTKAKGQISFGATVQSVKTNQDYTGGTMWIDNYTKTGKTTPEKKVSLEVERLVPQFVVKMSRRESVPGARTQADIINTFVSIGKEIVGKLNTSQFLAGATGTWLCTRMEGRSEDDNVTYLVDYEFQYNEKGWSVVGSYVDPETKEIPDDVTNVATPDASGVNIGNGTKSFILYKGSDFNQQQLA